MSQYEWETGYGYAPSHEAEYGGLLHEDSPLHEVEEMELASELLEINSEDELEEFLGDLVKGVAKAAGGLIRSPLGQALTGVLKTAAKTALPVVGGALGSMVAPGIGTALGTKLGSMASNAFELDLEGMDHEQAEFEVARRYVQLAASTARNAALAPPGLPPEEVAHEAFDAAARRHAPGLVGMPDGQGFGAGEYGLGGYGGHQYGGHHHPHHHGHHAHQGSHDQWGGYGGHEQHHHHHHEGHSGYGEFGSPGEYGSADEYGSPGGHGGDDGAHRGRWVRRGRKIVIYDA